MDDPKPTQSSECPAHLRPDLAPTESDPPRRHWAIYAWEVCLGLAMLAFTVHHATAIRDYVLAHPLLFAVECVVAWMVADFACGCIHWAGDTCGTPQWPIVGPALIGPFRRHHHEPDEIVTHDVLEINGNGFLMAVVMLTFALVLPMPARVVIVVGAWWGCATNQIHKWAHMPDCPRPVQWLQRSGLILSAEAHARHHRGNFDRSYCITSGFCNPLLDRIVIALEGRRHPSGSPTSSPASQE